MLLLANEILTRQKRTDLRLRNLERRLEQGLAEAKQAVDQLKSGTD